MRLQLQLRCVGPGRVLPINYRYETAAWIYRVIHRSDAPFAKWLHEHGYSYNGRRFKNFTFSHMRIPEREITGDRIHIRGERADMQIAFAVDRAVEHFIAGLFDNQEFSIGDDTSRADFSIENVETLVEPGFQNTLRLRCLSPICVSRGNAGASATYLGPDAADYAERIAENLRNKLGSMSADPVPEQPLTLRPLGAAKSRLIHIKSGKQGATRVRAFQFPLELGGPAELLRVAYQAGLGEKNSLGFGCVGVRT